MKSSHGRGKSKSGRAVRLAGSRLPRPHGATREAAGSPRERLELTLKLRSRPGIAARKAAALASVLGGRRPPFTRGEFAAAFGAGADDIAAIRRWAARRRVTILRVDPARRSVDIRATAGHLARLFHVTRVGYRLGDRTWQSFTGMVSVPAELASRVIDVLGFDGQALASRSALPQNVSSRKTGRRRSFTAPEVARLYGFPSGLDGGGQTVGVIALGGGYTRADLRAYFRRLKLPSPSFTDVSVCGARNAPTGVSRGSDGEVTGDIETVGALVPAARIVVYFAPNTYRGFLESVSQAVYDTLRAPSVLSISWGSAEGEWARRVLRLLNDVLSDAAILGVTICCSSGDHGGFADLRDRLHHVSFPASSPFVVACGGTSLAGTRGTTLRETAWRDTFGASGGGVSEILPQPTWQSAVGVPTSPGGRRGRAVPDVAANADPGTPYRVFVGGRWCTGAGTSAAAPLWAGFIARLNQRRGAPVGLITPFLYRQYRALVKAGALRPIRRTAGARLPRGWNHATGLGAPGGTSLAAAIMVAFARIKTR